MSAVAVAIPPQLSGGGASRSTTAEVAICASVGRPVLGLSIGAGHDRLGPVASLHAICFQVRLVRSGQDAGGLGEIVGRKGIKSSPIHCNTFPLLLVPIAGRQLFRFASSVRRWFAPPYSTGFGWQERSGHIGWRRLLNMTAFARRSTTALACRRRGRRTASFARAVVGCSNGVGGGYDSCGGGSAAPSSPTT